MLKLPFVFLITCIPVIALAHSDDPKVLDRVPPYPGPGWRSAGAERSTTGLPPIQFPAQNVSLLSWISLPEFGENIANANDCWGYVSPSGREYAIIGLSTGTAFVEVSNPGDAQIVEVVAGPISLWRDIKVYQHYAYSVSEGGGGIQIIDMDQIDAGVVTLVNSIDDIGTDRTHNVVINEASGFMYRCGGSTNGLRIYSLADPVNPEFVASWPDRYVHDAQVVTFTEGEYAGKEIAFCCSGFGNGSIETGLDILDVTSKDNIINLSRTFYSNAAYSHQAWLSADRQYLYLNDELDERDGLNATTTTRIMDVSDLENPFEATTFTNGNTSIDHNMYILGSTMFASNYRSGLRIFDASNPLAPVETGFFDTWPEDDEQFFNGLWSNYPFLPSGIVIGSDIEKGMFVWLPGGPQLIFSYPQGRPDLLDPDGDSIRVQVQEQGAALQPGSLKLHYDHGAGFVTVDLIEISADTFDAIFPAIPCRDQVSFYLTGSTTSGLTWHDPPGAPTITFGATSALDEIIFFADDGELDLGWLFENVGASSGDWERGVPVNDPDWEYDPASDSDGSGQCFLTQNELGNTDVDGGAVRLVSPTLDMTQGDVTVSYDYYLMLTETDGSDGLTVEIDNADGLGTWVEIARHDTSGGPSWRHNEVDQEQIEVAGVALTDTMRLRFTAEDVSPGRIVEAGVDAITISQFQCQAVAETCDDGLQNQGEDLIDCGGPCSQCECLVAADCIDGAFCNGLETCDVFGQCLPGGDPCPIETTCDEDLAECIALMLCETREDCDDGDACTTDLCIELVCDFPPRFYGDVNNDNTRNIIDVICVARVVFQDASECNGFAVSLEDVDLAPGEDCGDGALNIIDLIVCARAVFQDAVDECCGG